jgi:tRNA modification GTPase
MNRGALVVIAGEPNVGKSTLLNALTESDRAITSTIPGTTRDAIDVPLLIGGVPINLIDTAGIRSTEEEIESEGVRRSQNYIKKADLVLFVRDATSITSQQLSMPENIPVITLQNKSDLLSKDKNDSGLSKTANMLYISAKTGDGLDILKNRVKDVLGINPTISDILSITTSRQRGALLTCQKRIINAGSLLKESPVSYELISIELREALDSIASILGKTTPDDILNNIFNQFCVGK